jgi:hypothetical protein
MVRPRKSRAYLIPWILSLIVGALMAGPLADLVAERFSLTWLLTFWFTGGVISAATFITHELIREEASVARTGHREPRLKAQTKAA